MAACSEACTQPAQAAGASGEEGKHVKPFTPEKAKEIIMSLRQPAVFFNMTSDWPAQHWTANHVSKLLPSKQIRFRMGLKSKDTVMFSCIVVPQFETACSYVEATLEEFLIWNAYQPDISGPFRDYDHSKFWAYADYKYFISLFEDRADVFQVLFVPRHWWHYVESIDPVSVSINSWIELEEDHLARVEEAITRMLVCALKTAENPHNTRAWLNPTEVEETSHEVNCHYLNGAVSAFLDHYRTSKVGEIQELGTQGESTKKEELKVSSPLEVKDTYSQSAAITMGPTKRERASPFGPHLVPVMPSSEELPSERRGAFERNGGGLVYKDDELFVKLSCATRQLVMKKCENALAEPAASISTTAPPRALVSTDDLLDCVVNPQVTKLVAQLLIQGKKL
ncbi:HSPB1-associated protein 1 isoform 6-T6 [Thomomys bottae]